MASRLILSSVVVIAVALCTVEPRFAAEAAPSLPRCAMDEGRDRVCGPRPGSLAGDPTDHCPASPTTLDLRLYQPAVYSDPRPDEHELVARGYPGLVFELQREREYPREQARGTFRTHGAIPLIECCYVKCVPIDVAAEGSTAGTPRGFCMQPPSGGTRFPARSASDCPRAVKVAQAYRAFSGKNAGGACCYAVPPPPAPAAGRR